jgi:hypothetical protein
MHRWLVVLALAGCSASGGRGSSDGGDGGGHADMLRAGDGGNPGGDGGAISCNPGDDFCLGSKLFTCNASGSDGTFKVDCSTYPPNTGNTSTNPFGCFPDRCPAGETGTPTACCRNSLPLCIAMSTSDPGFNATYYSDPKCYFGGSSGQGACSVSLCPTGVLMETAPSGDSVDALVVLDPAIISPGATVPWARFTSQSSLNHVTLMQGGASCTQWSGNVTFGADQPQYRWSLDLTCATGGLALQVDVSGTL